MTLGRSCTLWLLALIATKHLSMAAFCGTTAVPFRFEVLDDGSFVLGCAVPSCMCARGGADYQFSPTDSGEDGFIREGDLTREPSCLASAPIEAARCTGSYTAASCSGASSWVGGLIDTGDGTIGLQCCSFTGMRFATEAGRPVVHQGEVYSGGEVIRDGRQTGFDLISNIKRILGQDGSVAFELTVHRMNCLPDPTEIENDVALDDQTEITKILDKVVIQNPEFDVPETNDQVVQIGEAAVPVESPGYYYPVAGGTPACFTGDTQVTTTHGVQRMDQLKVGNMIEVPLGNATTFDQVMSFIHRMPDVEATFVRLELVDGTVVKLTPQHFIHRIKSCVTKAEKDINLVYAVEVAVGDCLLKKSPEGFIPVPVSIISTTSEKGIYAPMTLSGGIVVNDVMASCHNVIKAETLVHSFFRGIMAVDNTIRRGLAYVTGAQTADGHVSLPWGVEFLVDIVNNYLPKEAGGPNSKGEL